MNMDHYSKDEQMKKIAGIEVFTLEEIAEQADVTIESMRKYVKDGKLRAQKIGGQYYTTRDAVKDFIENRTQTETEFKAAVEQYVRAEIEKSKLVTYVNAKQIDFPAPDEQTTSGKKKPARKKKK